MKIASLLLLVIGLLMVSTSCFAQPRNPTWQSDGETVFASVGTGGFSSGAPGYFKLTDVSGNEFYFWIGTDAKLRYASAIALSYTDWGGWGAGDYHTGVSRFLGATPTTVGWEDASGLVVGAQTAP